MCGFLITSAPLTDEQYTLANARQRLRGPDLTYTCQFDKYFILHNLLSITGEFTPQPFTKYDCACVFNGQIYNSDFLGDFPSDGFCLLEAYNQFGLEFPNELDGEFAICIIDSRQQRVILATDPFGTKPLYFASDKGEIGVATYSSALESLGFKSVSKVPANTLVVIDRKDHVVRITRPVWKFDTNQYKGHCEDWILCFEEAIRKRTANTREKIFIGLSSGYDSGAIACELLNQDVPFKSYSFRDNEHHETIDHRFELISKKFSAEIVTTSDEERSRQFDYLSLHAEPGNYSIYSGRSDYFCGDSILEDKAATGLAIICARAIAEGRKIYLSGQGSDEIMSDYGHDGKAIYDHSNFGGLFPSDLDTIFPWPSFYGSTQESYLMKEEHVAGAYSVETRYPFLDKFLVQEFLHLDHKLKNYFYKYPIRTFFKKNNFPVAWDIKLGFVP